MNTLINHIKELIELDEKQVLQLTSITLPKNFEKDDVLLDINKTCKKLYFINEGLLKISFFSEEKEYIMKFFVTNEFCSVLDSLTTQMPSQYSIIALSESLITEIDYMKLKELAAQDQAFERILSHIPVLATQKMMARIRELLETEAKDRYLNFIKSNGHLINLISLKDLSKYLGISQVTLSRIRASL